MYANGQTLRHKTTNAIVRLAVRGDSAWEIGDKTAFLDEQGKPFVDDIDNYGPIYDEFGSPQYLGCPKKGPDLSLKRYIVSEKDMLAMRAASLRRLKKQALALEEEALGVLDGSLDRNILKPHGSISSTNIAGFSVTIYPPNASAYSKQYFSFFHWFLKRRKAKVLYTHRLYTGKGMEVKWTPCAYSFCYAGKTWIWNYLRANDLCESSI